MMLSTTALSSAWFFLLVAVPSLAAATTSYQQPSSNSNARTLMLRALEENGYQYMEDLSGYQMQFGKCVRVKVPNDDDDSEGNSYFYNGRYYAQQQTFASVFLCDPYSNNGNSDSESEDNNQCGVCDTSKEYVTDLETYLQTTLAYAEAMCTSCQAQCGNNNNNNNNNNRNRRHLEQEEEQEEEYQYMNVDCNTCVNICANMNFNSYDQGEGNGDQAEGDDQQQQQNDQQNYVTTETAFLECQEAFQDQDGIQMYAGPQCDSDGNIIIGFYYDDECTVKSSSKTMDYYGFNYNTFRGLQNMCYDCANAQDDGGNVCDDIYQDSTHCSNGSNLNDGGGGGNDGDLPICKTYLAAHREHHYAKRRRNWRIAETLVAVVLVGGFLWGFLTLSYTYYLRHRDAPEGKVPLAVNDHHQANNDSATGTGTGANPVKELPPLT